MSLADSHCTPGAGALPPQQAAALMQEVRDWAVVDGRLARTFRFRDYHEVMAFVNALAWVSHTEDHHPELTVTYDAVSVRYNTHSAGGALSLNDFICATRADALYGQRCRA